MNKQNLIDSKTLEKMGNTLSKNINTLILLLNSYDAISDKPLDNSTIFLAQQEKLNKSLHDVLQDVIEDLDESAVLLLNNSDAENLSEWGYEVTNSKEIEEDTSVETDKYRLIPNEELRPNSETVKAIYDIVKVTDGDSDEE